MGRRPLRRGDHYHRLYGITTDTVEAMLDATDHTCPICQEAMHFAPVGSGRGPKHHTPCVDHCHTSGQVRGLICSSCNKALGLLKDRPSEWAERALAYLKGCTSENNTPT